MSGVSDLDLIGEWALGQLFPFTQQRGFEVEVEEQWECKQKPPCGNGCGSAGGSGSTFGGGVTSVASDFLMSTAGPPDKDDAGNVESSSLR